MYQMVNGNFDGVKYTTRAKLIELPLSLPPFCRYHSSLNSGHVAFGFTIEAKTMLNQENGF